jgi:hypothetical protein
MALLFTSCDPPANMKFPKIKLIFWYPYVTIHMLSVREVKKWKSYFWF